MFFVVLMYRYCLILTIWRSSFFFLPLLFSLSLFLFSGYERDRWDLWVHLVNDHGNGTKRARLVVNYTHYAMTIKSIPKQRNHYAVSQESVARLASP